MEFLVNRLKQLISYLGLIGVSIGVWVFIWSEGVLDGFEQEAMRWRYLVRGEQQSTAPIVYVDLDADAVSKIGARPWDRKNFSLLVDALLGPGEANVVGFDIIFSMFTGGSLLDYDRARAGDLSFGQSIEYFEGQVVLAAAYTGTTSVRQGVLPLRREDYLDPRENPFPEAPSYPILTESSGRLGLANVDEVLSKGTVPYWLLGFVDIQGELFSMHLMDGKQRHLVNALNEPEVVVEGDQLKLVDQDGWTPYVLPRHTEQRLLALGLELFLAANDLGAESVEYDRHELLIRRDGEIFRRIPLDADGQSVEVNWFEGWSTPGGLTEHYSMRDVLERADLLGQAAERKDTEQLRVQLEWFARFKDKVIFVGPVDPQLKDTAPTPFNREPVPKVGLHANLYRTIQDEAYIVRLSGKGIVATIVLLSLVVTSLVLWSGAGRRVTRIGSIGVVLLYTAAVFFLFSNGSFVVPLVAPVGAALSAALLVLLVKLGSEEWQRRRMKALFGAYVSPELVDEMVESGRDPELGGTEAEVSALFSDVEGFSAFSEQLPPNELVPLMNEYLSAMTDALQAEGGTLDKYIGDAIVVMFGMPLPIKDHAARACAAALCMQEQHAKLRSEWAQSGKWPDVVVQMRTRIGINTGVAVIGNMGSRVRFNYTMMGDSVNLAARCESGAKSYGVYTLISGATLRAALQAMPELFYRKLDRIVVKGRTEPVEIFELWDRTVDREAAVRCRDLYEEGLQLYFKGEWAAALERFSAAEADEPSRAFAPTTPSTVLAQRCRGFVESGGPADWDGAYRMQTK
ncbi:MAG: adenylate cyclase [Lentimonas sp.]